MALHLYIYFRLRTEDAAPRIRAAMQQAAATAQIESRLQRRIGDPSTWMEVYGPMPPALTTRLVDALDAVFIAHGLEEHVVGGRAGRTLEWFGDAFGDERDRIG